MSDSTTVAILGLATGTAIGLGMAILARPVPSAASSHNVSSSHNVVAEREREAKKETLARNRRRSNTLEDLAMECIDGGEAVRAGFSMAEALERNKAGAKIASQRSPTEVLSALQRGNTRFWMGVAQRPEVSAFERRALIMQQHPCVAILGCSDSRVPIEIVFDQGLGDIFVIRVAGNCLDTSTRGSLQYAVRHLRVQVVVVMGHEGCGAVRAARMALEDIEKEPDSLGSLLGGIKEGLDEKRLGHIHDQKACDREAVVSNVLNQVTRLKADAMVAEQIEMGDLIVVGAFYEMSSGIVDFIDTPDNK